MLIPVTAGVVFIPGCVILCLVGHNESWENSCMKDLTHGE